MGYIEKVMGDTERIVYRTHRHIIVLLQKLLGSLFAFLLFLGLGLVMLLWPAESQGDVVRFYIGLAVLCCLIWPLYLIVRAWLRGERGRDLWKSVWRPAGLGILILAVALVIMLRPQWTETGWAWVVLSLVFLAVVIRIVLDYANERYIITNRRVMEVRGIVNKHVRDSALEKVNDVELDQSFFGRILNYGTVEIITGSDIGVNEFHRIANPVRFKRAMLNAKEELHTGAPAIADEEFAPVGQPAPAAAGSTAGAAAAAPDSDRIPELIAELDALRQKGIISEEEFLVKKKDLLARL